MLDSPTIWQLYINTLSDWAQVPARDVFSVTAINTFSDLGDISPAVSNLSMFQLGNSVPAPGSNYSPRSSLFVSYWLYLTYRLQALGSAPQSLFGATRPAPDFELYRQLVNSQHPGNVTVNYAYASNAAATSGMLNTVHEQFKDHFASRAPALYKALDGCRRANLQQVSDLNMLCADNALAGTRCPLYRVAQWPQMLHEWRYRPALSLFGKPMLKVLDRVKIDLANTTPAMSGRAFAALGQPEFITLNPEASPMACSAVSMSLAMERFGTYAINPGPWFDMSQLDRSQAKPSPDAPDFLGIQGAMGLLPVQALIGFRPTLTLHVSSLAHAQSLADSVTRVGPFAVKAAATLRLAAGSTGEVNIDFDSQDCDLPVLLGVVSRRAQG
ncbi:MAG: hypothetical protein P0Y58_06525 [Candidatus Pseudomonas phytovorans]|uniref:Uncharacterized protein n=1 Tax=Candidatus Pseudomonas phytovorans TaxID=3121377 RepID=A0AAJ6BCG4_9PSED|nr:hypothetical protein [Pseudomonas sp.]WEK31848.1 MAG: hypothetical protein P0Y58_06525 [Pseudomonas sp.]